MVEKSPSKSNRRNVLKALGISAAGLSGLAGSSTASQSGPGTQEEAQRIIEVASKVGKRRGPEARAEFLRNRGIPTGVKRAIYSFPEEKPTFQGTKSDGVSTEKVGCVDPTQCDGDIDLSLSLSYILNTGDFYADLMVRMRYTYYIGWDATYYGGGEDPVDGIGFQWQRDRWQVRNPDDIPASTNGDSNIWWDNGSYNHEGLAFKVDDEGLCKDSGTTSRGEVTWSDYEDCGVYLDYGPDWESDDDITASYRHTWSGTVYSFGVSYPWGISVSSGSSVDSEDLQTDLNGNTLRVTSSDAQ